MRIRTFAEEQWLPRPRDEVFAFFADAGNLQAITPPWLHFRIVTPCPVAMRAGTLIEYRLRLFGAPFAWRTQIEVWEPGIRFVDAQLAGPYALWRHEHAFRAEPGGTQMSDTVDYALRFGPAGHLAHALAVRRWLDAIFEHRRRRIAELLAPRTDEGS